jgi:hypothetical protein
MHNEVPVKVTAWVDEGVAPLVTALDALDPDLVTVDSCQGHNGGSAYVSFIHRGSDAALLHLVAQVASVLSASFDAEVFKLRVEWAGTEHPMAELQTVQQQIIPVADSIQSISDRTSLSVYGR